MKPSTAKLFAMLPRYFILQVDGLDGHAIGAHVTDGDGKSCGLDAEYPGFASNLERLVKAGLVVEAAVEVQKSKAPSGHVLARIKRHYISLRPMNAKQEKAS